VNAALLFAAALATSDAPAPALDATVDDVTQLQGTWEVVAAMVNGEDCSPAFKGARQNFAGDVVQLPGDCSRIALGTARLDELSKNGRIAPGSYTIEGNSLVWNVSDGGGHIFRFTFRRVPK
jgi:hypothetical protein